jgi:hypothetical protein
LVLVQVSRSSGGGRSVDELGKGRGAGGVNWTLNQEEPFKHLVYDLLYDGIFQNWNKIRDLKYIYQNEEAVTVLKKARAEDDVESAQELVNDACGVARTARAEQRQLGANTRVKVCIRAAWAMIGTPRRMAARVSEAASRVASTPPIRTIFRPAFVRCSI